MKATLCLVPLGFVFRCYVKYSLECEVLNPANTYNLHSHFLFYSNRGATTSGTGSPKPEGEIAEAEASTPGKEPGRGFCEIQWPWWRGSTDSASKSSRSKVIIFYCIVNSILLILYMRMFVRMFIFLLLFHAKTNGLGWNLGYFTRANDQNHVS